VEPCEDCGLDDCARELYGSGLTVDGCGFVVEVLEYGDGCGFTVEVLE
jgi:hypothetical protein